MSGVARFLFGSPKSTNIAGFRVQTSAGAVPIPIVYGLARLAGNLVHMPKTPVLQSSNSSKLYSSKGSFSGQLYVAPILIALCEGPIDGIAFVWRDKDQHVTFVGNYDGSGSLGGWVLKLGTSAPAAWSYLTGTYPNQAVTYQFTAYVANPNAPLPGDSLSSYSWEIQGFKRFNPGTIDDASPADIIPDLLESAQYGLGWSSARLGSLTPFQDYCAAFSLFVSPVINSQTPARDTLNELLEVSNTGAVWSDGVLKLIPYGDVAATANGHTFTPNTTPLYDLTDTDFLPRGALLDPIIVTRKDPATTFNQVQVEYEDRDGDYNTTSYIATDQYALQTFGAVPMPTLSLHSIKKDAVAQQVAQMRLQREQNIRNTYQFRLGWKYSLLEPMDLVTLTDAQLGLSLTPVRLTVVEELANEQGIECTAEDWPLGTASATLYGVPKGTGTAPNANVDPGNTTTPVIFEGPSPLQSSPLEIWVGASGGVNWGGCDVYISVDNTNFTKVGRIVGAATFGVTTATLATNAAYPSIDTTHTLSVNVTASGGSLVAQSQQNFDNLIPLCYLAGEFVDYRDLALTSAFHYDLTHLYRGLYSSVIPASHSVGDAFVFCDEHVLRVPWPLGKIGQVVYFKLPAFNIYGAALQDISSISSVSHTVGQAPIIPGTTGVAVSQGTVSIDADGNWGFTADFPNTANSYRWLEGTGGFPSDAGTASGGATVNLSGLTTSTLNSQGTLSFGQTAFITIVPFTGASAGGTQMQPIHIRGSYLTMTATKTETFAAANWKLLFTLNGGDPTTIPFDSTFNPENFLMGPNDQVQIGMDFVIPNGVTITSVAFDARWNTAALPLQAVRVQLFRKTASGARTGLDTGTAGPTVGGGWQTVTRSFSEAVSSGYSYIAQIEFDTADVLGLGDPAAGGDASQAGAGNIAVTYTMPNPKQAL